MKASLIAKNILFQKIYQVLKGAIALSNIHSIVVVIDDVGIGLSCDIQDDLFLCCLWYRCYVLLSVLALL